MNYDTISATRTRPADTTAYAAGDVVGNNLAVTAASNTTPIVITTATHGLASGEIVTIASAGGNTAANGTWKITVLSTTTFSLDGSTGNGAWTSGGTVAAPFKFAGAASSGAAGQRGVIRSASLSFNDSTTTNAAFTLLLFAADQNTLVIPPVQADNVAQTMTAFTNMPYLLGRISFTNANIKVVGGYGTWESTDLVIPFKVPQADVAIYGVLIADAAYTPTSAEVFRATIRVDKQ